MCCLVSEMYPVLSVLQAWTRKTLRIYDIWLLNFHPFDVFYWQKPFLQLKNTNSLTLHILAQLYQTLTAEEIFKYQHIWFFLLVQYSSGIEHFCWYGRCQIWYRKWLIILLQTLLPARSLGRTRVCDNHPAFTGPVCDTRGANFLLGNKLQILNFLWLRRQHFQSEGSAL